jgi:hypothetical protein
LPSDSDSVGAGTCHSSSRDAFVDHARGGITSNTSTTHTSTRSPAHPLVQSHRQHALIRLEDDSLTLTDLGSTNGTYVNGKELERNVETAVKTSDVIVFGDGHLASFIYDASEE